MDRDRRILDAAAEAFYEKGFHGVGVDELGKRAGLSGPTLYRHFSGKDEILAALFNEAMDELVSATGMVDDDPFKDLDRLVRHHAEFAVSRRHLVSVYQREDRSLVDPWRRHFDHRRKQYVGRWETLISRCFPEADAAAVSAAAQAYLGLIFSIASWPTKVTQTPDLAQLIIALTREGLTALAGPAAR